MLPDRTNERWCVCGGGGVADLVIIIPGMDGEEGVGGGGGADTGVDAKGFEAYKCYGKYTP